MGVVRDRDARAGRIYFVADSGYGDGRHFRDVREQYGPLRLAILPIGAYEPRWFMREQHMNPAESVQAFIDCGAELALGHHYGTFQLTDEAIDAPLVALADALTCRRNSSRSGSAPCGPGRCGNSESIRLQDVPRHECRGVNPRDQPGEAGGGLIKT